MLTLIKDNFVINKQCVFHNFHLYRINYPFEHWKGIQVFFFRLQTKGFQSPYYLALVYLSVDGQNIFNFISEILEIILCKYLKSELPVIHTQYVYMLYFNSSFTWKADVIEEIRILFWIKNMSKQPEIISWAFELRPLSNINLKLIRFFFTH